MNEISLVKPAGFVDWVDLYKLYLEAFPASERKPWGMICRMYRKGRTDIWCLVCGGKFVGLAMTINGPDVILLDYFAICKSCRGQGMGTAALKAILNQYRDKGLFLEIESTLEPCPDLAMRQRRKKFYLNCGLQQMHTTAFLFGVKMELLGVGCHLDFGQYKAFCGDNYCCWVADHITPAD